MPRRDAPRCAFFGGWPWSEAAATPPALYEISFYDYTSTWLKWDGTSGRVPVQSSPEKDVITPEDDTKSDSRKSYVKGNSQELQTTVMKKTKHSAHWGRSLPSRTLTLMLCVCLPTCCFADSVGKPRVHGLTTPGPLDAYRTKPSGLPVRLG